jgi:hypothetical protein
VYGGNNFFPSPHFPIFPACTIEYLEIKQLPKWLQSYPQFRYLQDEVSRFGLLSNSNSVELAYSIHKY